MEYRRVRRIPLGWRRGERGQHRQPEAYRSNTTIPMIMIQATTERLIAMGSSQFRLPSRIGDPPHFDASGGRFVSCPLKPPHARINTHASR